MRHILGLPLFLAALLLGGNLQANGWDVHKAKGWARMDVTGSALFLDAENAQLVGWMKDAGVTETVKLQGLKGSIQAWLSEGGKLWCVQGNTLHILTPAGEPLDTESLPFEVADLVPGPNGFFVSYRTEQPYVERRDYQRGNVLWAFGPKPKKNHPLPQALYRITLNADRQVLLTRAQDHNVDILDGEKGKLLGQAVFAYKDGLPPALALGSQDRGPLFWWVDQSVAVACLPPSALPAGLGLQGPVLARLDFSGSAITFMGSGLPEGSLLVGVQDKEAYFILPAGGLQKISLAF